MHTTGDGLVVPENEQAYRQDVDRAGDGRLLRQIFVHRAGHWHVPSAIALNATAASLGTTANVLPPQFTPYRPDSYLRPFDLRARRW